MAVALMDQCLGKLASTLLDAATIAQPCQQSRSDDNPNPEWAALSADAPLSGHRQPRQRVVQRGVDLRHNR